jgi:hypothetical protein
MLYLVCAVSVPTKKDQEAGIVEEVIGKLEVVCADEESSAIVQYTNVHLADQTRAVSRKTKVVVRPFK